MSILKEFGGYAEMVLTGVVESASPYGRDRYRINFTDRTEDGVMKSFIFEKSAVLSKFNNISKYEGKEVSLHYRCGAGKIELHEACLNGQRFIRKGR